MVKLVLITYLMVGGQPQPVAEAHHPYDFGDTQACEQFANDGINTTQGWQIFTINNAVLMNYECREIPGA